MSLQNSPTTEKCISWVKCYLGGSSFDEIPKIRILPLLLTKFTLPYDDNRVLRFQCCLSKLSVGIQVSHLHASERMLKIAVGAPFAAMIEAPIELIDGAVGVTVSVNKILSNFLFHATIVFVNYFYAVLQ